jgi:hypothetical protein
METLTGPSTLNDDGTAPYRLCHLFSLRFCCFRNETYSSPESKEREGQLARWIEEADRQVNDDRSWGYRKVISPWCGGVVLVEKKDGTQGFCIDFRRTQ